MKTDPFQIRSLRLVTPLLLFSCLLILPGIAPGAPKPNVIYILADDLGYGDLSCYGQKKFKTPNIDRLASEGLLFTDHYSGNTVCSPSRASLMTGQHPGHCYLRSNTGPKAAALDPAMTVLPEVFRAAGYTTGAFGKWGMGVTCNTAPENPLGHGFDEFFGWKSQVIAHTYYPTSVVHNGKELPLEAGTYVHPLVMEKAREFIRRSVKDDRPFFCYIPTAIPHAAMHAPKQLHEKWRKKFPEFDKKIGKYGAGPGESCPPVQNPIAGFAAMMEHLDNEVGEILPSHPARTRRSAENPRLALLGVLHRRKAEDRFPGRPHGGMESLPAGRSPARTLQPQERPAGDERPRQRASRHRCQGERNHQGVPSADREVKG